MVYKSASATPGDLSRRARDRQSALARAGDHLGAAALRGASWLAQRLPDAAGLAVARVLAAVWYLVDRRHRAVVESNLQAAYGDTLSATERTRLCRDVFRNLAFTVVEFLTMPGWTYADMERMVALDAMERVDRALTEGRGVIMLAAHFGSWELMAGCGGLRGMPVAAVARPLDQPAVNAAVTAIRESTGLKVIQRRTGALAALRTLRKGGCLGIVADQNTRKDNVFVEFFGRPAATTPAPAFFALKTGAPILPCYLRRTGPRQFVLEVESPVPLSDTGDFERDVLLTTQRCAAELERMVRRYPDQWFWIHRRWKTQPPAGWTPPHAPKTQTLPAG